jgi:ferredoxin, 2Fe-2S
MERRLTVGSLIYDLETKTNPVKPEDKSVKTFIRIRQKDWLYQISPVSNKLLLDCALKQNVPLDYKCRKGTCGKCMVEILEGHQLLYPQNKTELKKTPNPNFRLACQALIK